MNATSSHSARRRFSGARLACAVCAALGAAAAATGSASAQSTTVYSTGFENPPFAAGSQLVGQDGWTGLAPPPGQSPPPPNLNPQAATIQGDLPRSGAQFLRVQGSDLQTDPTTASLISPYQAIGSYRRNVNYNAGAAGLPVVRVQADVRLDGPLAASPEDFFSATVAAIAPNPNFNGTAGEIGISSDGIVRAYAPGASGGSTPVAEAPISLNEYHTLAVEVDFAANNVRYFVDGQALGGGPFSFPAGQFPDDVLSRGSLVAYALPDAGGAQRANYTARYDNFAITAVPEPGGLALLGLGAAAALGTRRRRRPR